MQFLLDLDELKKLRHELHQNAELSNNEENTARIIKNYLSQYNPDEIIDNIGGHGLVAVFKGEKEGKNIGFRADMDALPIDEHLLMDHSSKTQNVAHKCGHDGHMTMVAGLAPYLHKNKPKYGNVYLVYQPAEETGEGAQRVNKSLKDRGIMLDYLFGLHNLPGFVQGEIVSKAGTFAAASKGMVISLFGETSHAAEPENGKSPVLAVSEIISEMTNVHNNNLFSALTLATVIHIQMGEIAFGTTPGYAEVRITLRAMDDYDMSKLTTLAEDSVAESAKKYKLDFKINYTETFTATENTEEIFETLKEAARSKDIVFNHIEKPFKWSEDFGQYKNNTKTGFFGLGAGIEMPSLHNKEYDFPDEITETGVNMYIGLIEHIAKNV